MRPLTALLLLIGIWMLIIAAIMFVNEGYFGPNAREGFLMFFGNR